MHPSNTGGGYRPPTPPSRNRPFRRPSKRDLSGRLDALEQTFKANLDTTQQEADKAFDDLFWPDSKRKLFNAYLAQCDGRPFTPEESGMVDRYWLILKNRYPRAFAQFHGKTLFPFDIHDAYFDVVLSYDFCHSELISLERIFVSGPCSPEDEALLKRLEGFFKIDPVGCPKLIEYYAKKEALQNETRTSL